MKKIFLLVLVLLGYFASNAQAPSQKVYIAGSTANNTVVGRGTIEADLGFLPPLRDTNYIPARNGAKVVRPQDGKEYMFLSSPGNKQWFFIDFRQGSFLDSVQRRLVIDTTIIKNVGAVGVSLGFGNGSDSIFFKKLIFGGNMSVLQNSDSSLSINAVGSFANPMTLPNQIIVGGTSGTAIALNPGANNTFLGINGSGVLGYFSPPGAVSSVANSDGTLLFSPNTGAVLGGLNLNHTNTWVPIQNFGALSASGTVTLTGNTYNPNTSVTKVLVWDTVGHVMYHQSAAQIDLTGVNQNYTTVWSVANQGFTVRSTQLVDTAGVQNSYGVFWSSALGHFIVSSAGAGTLTTLSIVNNGMAPLFSTNITNQTSAPAITFTLTPVAAHNFFGNFSNVTGVPAYGSPLLASADFNNQGSSIANVLHGASGGVGPPSWGLIDMAISMTGVEQAAQSPAFIGNVTKPAGSLVTAIANNVITNAMLNQKISLANGGTGVDLSATGGTSQVLKQVTAGGTITVGQVSDADLLTSNVTTNNATASKHGFVPILSNVAGLYFESTGGYTAITKLGTVVSGNVDAILAQSIATNATVNFSTLGLNGGTLNIGGTNENRINFNNLAGSGVGFIVGRSIGNNDNNDFFITDVPNSSPRFQISSTGVVDINNLAGTGTRMVIADASGNLSTQAIPSGTAVSGTYVPSLTNSTNVASSSVNSATYSQIGNVFHVRIEGNVTATSSSTPTLLTFSLPASSTINISQLTIGSGVVQQNISGNSITPGVVYRLTGTTGQLEFITTNTTSQQFVIIIDYTL